MFKKETIVIFSKLSTIFQMPGQEECKGRNVLSHLTWDYFYAYSYFTVCQQKSAGFRQLLDDHSNHCPQLFKLKEAMQQGDCNTIYFWWWPFSLWWHCDSAAVKLLKYSQVHFIIYSQIIIFHRDKHHQKVKYLFNFHHF